MAHTSSLASAPIYFLNLVSFGPPATLENNRSLQWHPLPDGAIGMAMNGSTVPTTLHATAPHTMACTSPEVRADHQASPSNDAEQLLVLLLVTSDAQVELVACSNTLLGLFGNLFAQGRGGQGRSYAPSRYSSSGSSYDSRPNSFGRFPSELGTLGSSTSSFRNIWRTRRPINYWS